MKKVITLLLCVFSAAAFGQSYPSPTYHNLTVTGTSTLGAAPTMGASTIFPTVPTEAALHALATTTTTVVTRMGYLSQGDISPTVYVASGSACSLGSGVGDGGSQVQSADSKCWIASFSPGEIDSRQWGVIANGATTDNTAALQAAWNYAASVNRDLLLPPSNSVNYVKFSSITAPTPTNGNTGNRSALVGQGEGLTFLESTATGSNCAITLTATFGVNSWYNDTFRDFTLGGSSNVGQGICLTNITHASFSHIYIQNFNNGVFAQDSFDISWIECTWNGIVNAGVSAAYVSNSHPNAWTFIDPHFFFCINYGIIFQNPADLNIIGGDWENDNISGTAGASAVYINGNPIEGTKGLTMTGGYFSLNGGAADITIADVDTAGGGTNLNGAHSVTGVEFQRASNTQFTTNNILLNNTGTGVTNLSVRSNGFQGFNAYPPSASRLYVAETTPAATTYTISSGGNWFQSATETPTGPWWNETGWTAYTPTLGCGSGTLTTASITGSYKRLTAKTIAAQFSATVTTLGTCASYMTVTLPTNANSAELGSIRNTTSNVGGTVATAAGNNTMTGLTATGTLPLSSGTVENGSIVYESQ
jgi:hypothetical protein